MATALDLEEQEKLDALKNFWDKWGNLIICVLIVVLGSFAAWQGYKVWKNKQAEIAAVIYDQLETAAQAKDVAKVERAWNDIKSNQPKTIYAQQAGLMAAKIFYEADRAAAARDALDWVVNQKDSYGYQSLARLRLAGLWLEDKQYDKALKILSTGVEKEFEALAQDLRGDIYAAQNQNDKAQTEYKSAYQAMDTANPLRGVLSIKLASVGFDATTLDPKKDETPKEKGETASTTPAADTAAPAGASNNTTEPKQ